MNVNYNSLGASWDAILKKGSDSSGFQSTESTVTRTSWWLTCCFVLFSLFIGQGVYAQASAYGFASDSGTFTPLVAGTSSGLGNTADDAISPAFNIGFTFTFNDVAYTQVQASSNGPLLFGTGRSQSAANNLASTTLTQRPGVAAIWDDLQVTSGVTYQVSGTSPNQVLTVEWLNVEWNYQSITGVISYQVKLYETSNIIEFIYRPEATAYSAGFTGGASAGIMGAAASDFISLSSLESSATTSTSVSTNSIITKPVNGQIFRFSPPSGCTGTPAPGNTVASAASVCSGISFSLSLQNATSGSGVSYSWQSADDMAFTTNVATVTGSLSSISTSQTVAKYYRATVSCGANSATSNPILVGINPGNQCYNANYATATADEDISNVQVGSLNNTSNCTVIAPDAGSILNRYGNYRTSVAAPALAKGSDVSFSVTQTTCGTSPYSNGFQIFIDYNQDGDFSDAGERVYNQPTAATGNHTKTGIFTVPVDALNGVTVMRVVVVETTFPTTTDFSTAAITWGEVEEYSVNIVNNTACAGTPTPGNTIASVASGCAGFSSTLTLQNTTLGSGVSYMWERADDMAFTTNVETVAGTTSSISVAPTASKYYRATVSCGSDSGVSTPVLVTVNPQNQCYCAAGATSASFEKISNITFGTINNASTSTAGYEDFTSLSTEVIQGNSYPFSASISGGFASDQIVVFIDFNQDGDFTDADEIVYTSLEGVGPFAGTIVIPSNALAGNTRMRVRLTDNGTFDSCGNTSFGQVEDYTVTIVQGVPCSGAPTAGTAVASVTEGNVCTGSINSTISLNGVSTGTGITFQWQSSPSNDANSFTDIAGATSSSYSAVGLTATTYFRAIVTCSTESSTSTSVVVTVSGTPTFATLPYVQDFESWISGCATSDIPDSNWKSTPSTGNNSWRRNDQGFSTATWNYINDEPAPYQIPSSTGLNSARFHSFGAMSGTGILDLYVDLSAAGTKTLTFDFVNPSGTDKLDVLLSSDGGLTFGSILLTAGTSSAFSGQTLTFTGTSANSIIRFRATTDFGEDDLGIDNLVLQVTPSCVGVAFQATTAITSTSATINFTAGIGASSYTLNYSPGGSPQTLNNTDSVVLTNLNPYTLYTVTITSNCGEESATSSLTFRTLIGNDECSGAAMLMPAAVGAACTPVTYTLTGATNSGVTSPCTTLAGGDVWFSFVATSSAHNITVVPTYDVNAVIELRSGSCPGVNIECQNSSTTGGTLGTEILEGTNLVVGATYFVRVYNATVNAASFNFDICVSTIDVCTPTLWYADADGDGFGDASMSVEECEAPEGYVADGTDCDDTNDLVWQTGTFFVDVDNDGFTVGAAVSVCYGATTPTGYSVATLGEDCNDANSAINPNATEIPGNGIDENCNGPADDVLQGNSFIQCGATIDIYKSINTGVVQGATGYRFRVTNVTNVNGPNTVQVIDRMVPWFQLTSLASYEYNTTYNVEVAVKTTGDYSTFSTGCFINTRSWASLPLGIRQCGATYTNIYSPINAGVIPNVSGYRFRFTNLATNEVEVISQTLTYTNLAALTTYVAGASYSVEVAVKTTGDYGDYGPACTINAPAAIASNGTTIANANFKVVASPNPFSDTFAVAITEGAEGNAEVKVYDMIGKLLEVRSVQSSEISSQQLGNSYPSGVYNVIVTQGQTVKTLKVIKR